MNHSSITSTGSSPSLTPTNMEKKLIFLKGIPASGKSTYAESLQGYVILSKDYIRRIYTDKSEKLVMDIERQRVVDEMRHGRNIVIDNTHFNPIHESHYRKVAETLWYEFIVKEFRTPLNDCIERNRRRKGIKRVPDSVIYEMAKQSGWYEEELRPFNTNKKKPHVVCVDIDGTVALMNGRNPYDYSKVFDDLPNTPIVTLVRDLDVENRILFVSGRPDSCKELTNCWIGLNVTGTHENKLFMRKTWDSRPDYQVKEEIYREICKDYYVDYVIDDRTQVVSRLRALGFTVLQVADGNF